MKALIVIDMQNDFIDGALGTPEEAIRIKGGCLDRVAKDPFEEFFCYDDEDK